MVQAYPLRLLRDVGNLKAGDIIGPKTVVTPNPTPAPTGARALIGGIPAGANMFKPSENIFKIKTDTYSGALHPNSTSLVSDLVSQIGANPVNLNTYQYNAHTFLVDSNTPTVKVEFVSWNGTDIKRPLFDTYAAAVPMPVNAQPSKGNDRAMIIYNPTTGQLWEMWKARPKPGRAGSDNYYNAPYKTDIGGEYQASFIGYIADVRQNRGVFDTINGLTYGTAATSISYLGSAISIADVDAGVIDHAIALQVISAAQRASYYWPAERSDGNGGSPILEGQRFRFPPTLNIDGIAGLNQFSRMVMRAIQKYGMIVTDKAGSVSLVGESGGVEFNADGSTKSPSSWNRLRSTYGNGLASYNVLQNVPWNLLQAMPPDYGKPGSYTDPNGGGGPVSPVSGVQAVFDGSTRRVTVNWAQPRTYQVGVTRTDNLGNTGSTTKESSLGTYEFTSAIPANATSVTVTVTGPDGSSGSATVSTA